MVNLKQLGLVSTIFFMALSFSIKAEELSKTATIVFDQVEVALKQLKANDGLNSTELKGLVNTVVLPHIDHKYFTFKVLGKHLEKLTPEQRAEFVELLTIDLVSNYAESLKRYNNEKITVVSSTLAPSGKLASVAMKFTGQDKPINATTKWRMSDKDSEWYIYDFVVEGVSLLQTKQKELGSQLSSTGILGTIDKLKSKTAKG
ncbi:ABC transporter substrate-binding protein [Psychrosphaera sp. B3R10]|uniref:MlaC/ttg2D family ABC transporter substrate-binding protein n=1 Tax=unclassified Psychrosphaera TaxID=2641570 RepID=UPI001C082613|nr:MULTISPECIES: ABC transporter substrate-binding protein [unclassified Psychrosphaera]MBU2880779.1 ABC transporter substrate-binding protein [Psychrosphaera sp. I2R16]MBU2991475.1 ABC transporter substrate-binding protein [Psychrosphaera sp. B3R10]